MYDVHILYIYYILYTVPYITYSYQTHIYIFTQFYVYCRAGKNKAWTEEMVADFKHLELVNPYIHFHTMPHVGHWLHTEDLHGMTDLISSHSV